MKRPFFSVIVPTARLGGMDVIFDSLERQTFKDFEVILVDALFRRRRLRARRMFKAEFTRPFRIVHAAPDPLIFPMTAISMAYNTGIALAQGRVLLFTTDYNYFNPRVLELHAEQHNKEWGHGVSAPARWREIPEEFVCNALLKRHRQRWSGEHGILQMNQDLQDGQIDELLWTTLQNLNTREQVRALPLYNRFNLPPGRDHRLSMPAGRHKGKDFWGKNDSLELETVLDMGGWDVSLDGTHGWHDVDFYERSVRLPRVKPGADGEPPALWPVEWTLIPSEEACVEPLNIRPYLPRLLHNRIPHMNYGRYSVRIHTNYTNVMNNSEGLRGYRNTMQEFLAYADSQRVGENYVPVDAP